MDYPELPLARDAVSLYLGCGHSTGNVERLLKLVAIREQIRSPAFIQDVMFCFQAPKVKLHRRSSARQGVLHQRGLTCHVS